MKKSIFRFMVLVGYLGIISSCQKEIDPTPETIDRIKSLLPKQISHSWRMGLVDSQEDDISYRWEEDSVTFSIKYDTMNRKIEFYLFDRVSNSPSDKPVFFYTFNKGGYLVNFAASSGMPYNYRDVVIEIKREADDRVHSIIYDHKELGRRDTTFYRYQALADDIYITSEGYGGYDYGTMVYHYNHKNVLLEYKWNSGDDYFSTFYYNADGSLSKMNNKGPAGYNVSEFFYSSSLPHQQEDWLCRLLLGKDYYLPDLWVLNPFMFFLDPDYDNYSISPTNPYHITKMVDTHKPDASPSGIEVGTMQYKYNAQNLLTTVTFTKEADEYFPASTETIHFKY